MRGLALLAVLVVLVFIGFGVYFTFLQQRRAEDARQAAEQARAESESYVIGRELEAARQAEKKRLAEGGFAKSSMPKARYDLGVKEHGLLLAKRQTFEDDLAAFCRSYAEKSEKDRADVRASLDQIELYTLLHFAKRSAVFGVREDSIEFCRDGFNALAMIEKERIDWRDFLVCCGHLDYATRRVAKSSDAEFVRAKKLAEPKIAEMLGGFSLRREPLRTLRAWNKTEYRSGADFGFLASDGKPFAPRADLTEIGVQIAQFLDDNRYRYPTLTVATRIPTVWFGTPDKAALKTVLGRATGSISISAQPEGQEPFAHTFFVYVTEAATPADSDTLLHAAVGKAHTHAMRAGSLLCLVVSRTREGTRPFETADSLAELCEGIQKTLDAGDREKKK